MGEQRETKIRRRRISPRRVEFPAQADSVCDLLHNSAGGRHAVGQEPASAAEGWGPPEEDAEPALSSDPSLAPWHDVI